VLQQPRIVGGDALQERFDRALDLGATSGRVTKQRAIVRWIMTLVSPSNPTAQVSVLRQDASAAVIPQLTVEVADVGAVHADGLRRGLELVHPLTDEPWGVRRFFVKDPNGVVLNVASHRGDAATP
jgi:catechol 2,3-dioxygenase-like lactoylglutathione lyase family enzyme